jgi:hypothetical protein
MIYLFCLHATDNLFLAQTSLIIGLIMKEYLYAYYTEFISEQEDMGFIDFPLL